MQLWEEQNVGNNDESDGEHDITWDDDLKRELVMMIILKK